MKYFQKIGWILLALCGYQLLHQILNINQAILPSIDRIIISFYNNFNAIMYNATATIYETIVGLLLAIVIGLTLAIIINEFPHLKKVVVSIISTIQIIPLIAIAPLVIVWFGIGVNSKILLVIVYSAFSIVITTSRAFEEVSQSHYLYVTSLTSNKYKLYRYLYFPLATSEIFSGIKIATTYSVVCAITGEYLGGQIGIGILLNRAYSSYQTDLVFALIIVICVLTFGLLSLVQIIENKVLLRKEE